MAFRLRGPIIYIWYFNLIIGMLERAAAISPLGIYAMLPAPIGTGTVEHIAATASRKNCKEVSQPG